MMIERVKNMKNIRHAQLRSPIGPFCVTLLFLQNALNPEPTGSVNILLSEQFRSPAHRLHMKPNRTPIRALPSIHNLANMAAVGVKLCVSATPVEGLQNVRATCRRLIVQTGGVQTVPDIQHEDAIKMTPTHSFGLQTEEGYGKSGFGFRIKIENKKTTKLTESMKASVEESLPWKNDSLRLKLSKKQQSRVSYQTADLSKTMYQELQKLLKILRERDKNHKVTSV